MRKGKRQWDLQFVTLRGKKSLRRRRKERQIIKNDDKRYGLRGNRYMFRTKKKMKRRG